MLIQEFLAKKKLTQRAFADQIGCTVAFLNSIINGKNTDIKISLLRKLHDKTKIPESKLVSELLAFKQEGRGASGRGVKRKPKKQ